VSFAHDIRPLFRSLDIASMLPYDVLLGDYGYMSDPADDHRHARDVGDFLSGARQPRMPLDGPFWTDEQLLLYARWMSDGFQP
jgi:hypothetical protein